MPTGYTAKLCDEGQSFEEFVWRCARAMGCLIHMRDDALDAPIRWPSNDPFFDDVKHHEEHLARAKQELQGLRGLTVEYAREQMEDGNKRRLREYEESVKRIAPIRERLLRMHSQVSDWSPPTSEHEGLKNFMLQQLDETIKYEGEFPREPELLSDPNEWLRLRIEWAERDVNYHTRELEKARSRTDDRGEWLDQLAASVSLPASLRPQNALE